MRGKKTSITPVRLTDEEREQLFRIAEKTGLNVSVILRILISCLISHYKSNGETITLPLQWSRLVPHKQA